jgi:hypothetical protein
MKFLEMALMFICIMIIYISICFAFDQSGMIEIYNKLISALAT